MDHTKPDISVIVPVLNESAELPGLLASLASQENITLELILCDGGSGDGSQQTALERAAECDYPVRLVQTACGRGRQMNAGAAEAGSNLLLFLHADSRFEECCALRQAITIYRGRADSSPQLLAARFGLKFRRAEKSASLSWFFYEAKARLPRTDCIRGDQGFLLAGHTFSELGGFDESLPFLEDLRLVETASARLEWLLLPLTISTSARRFEKEGLLERQVLNAIIVNSSATGWTEFFGALPDIYRCHTDSGRLLLHPLLEGISGLIAAHDPAWCQNFWRATGRHVAGNAWQLFFWLDTRRAFRQGKDPGGVVPSYLNFYQQHLESLCTSRSAACIAQILVKLWLRGMLFKGKNRTA